MKKILMIVAALGCVLFMVGGAVIAGLFGIGYFVYQGTQPIVDAADGEFKLVASGKTHEAYEAMAPAFKARCTEENFKSLTHVYHIDAYQSASWSNRNINNDTGRLEGSVKSSDNIVSDVIVGLVKEGSTWKVASIWRGIAPALHENLPGESEAKDLSTQIASSIVDSVKGNSLAPFKDHMNPALVKEIKEDANLQYFSSFGDKSSIAASDIKVDSPPAWDEQGSLLLVGTMKLGTGQLKYSYRFVKPEGKWQLIGYDINTVSMAQPKADEAKPEAEEKTE